MLTHIQHCKTMFQSFCLLGHGHLLSTEVRWVFCHQDGKTFGILCSEWSTNPVCSRRCYWWKKLRGVWVCVWGCGGICTHSILHFHCQKWNSIYHQASTSLENREKKLDDAAEEIERVKWLIFVHSCTVPVLLFMIWISSLSEPHSAWSYCHRR